MYTIFCLLAFAVVPTLGARLPYIIAGNDVTSASKWPWQGSLRLHGSHTCGCALLSSQWAVTAAHCLGAAPIAYEILFGSVNRKSGGTIAYIDMQIKHEGFGEGDGNYPNDIGLIKFDRTLTLSDTISPVKRTTKDHSGNTDCYITGWGYTETGGSGRPSEILQEAKIPVETNEECSNIWGSDINDGHVCVWDPEGKRGACNGDSGGPLVCKNGGDYELVGVMSWGNAGCYPIFFPSVYTRIAYFSDWIDDNMN